MKMVTMMMVIIIIIITIFVCLEQRLTLPFWINLHLSGAVFLELNKAGNPKSVLKLQHNSDLLNQSHFKPQVEFWASAFPFWYKMKSLTTSS